MLRAAAEDIAHFELIRGNFGQIFNTNHHHNMQNQLNLEKQTQEKHRKSGQNVF